MKFIEIRGSLLQPVSNEENLLFEKIKGSELPFPKEKLTEREQVLAKNLVYRGILTKVRMKDKLCFISNSLDEIWGI